MRTFVPLELQAAEPAESSRTVAAYGIRELTSLALDGLVAMFDERRQLFCHNLIWTGQGALRKGASRRYTAIALLGLRKLQVMGVRLPFDLQAIFSSLVDNLRWIAGVGDAGLLIWLSSLLRPDQTEDMIRSLDCESAFDRYGDAEESRTTELAWFLAGLSHVAELSPRHAALLTDVAVETYHRIEENQGEYGLFGHMSSKRSVAGRLRGRIGNFADQAYSIYAMSQFAKAFHVEDPLGPALECAAAICSAQGHAGQWWWLYDTGSGRVSNHYPVYSVHQYGLAPMALFALEEATGQNFHQSICKGVRWIQGLNEAGIDMRDGSKKMVWRCVLPKRRGTRFWEMALSLVWPPNNDAGPGPVEVAFEQRPYEFGWLLFAFASQTAMRFSPIG